MKRKKFFPFFGIAELKMITDKAVNVGKSATKRWYFQDAEVLMIIVSSSHSNPKMMPHLKSSTVERNTVTFQEEHQRYSVRRG